MGNLTAVTSESEYDVISNEPWNNGRIYFLKSDADEGATLSVTVTFTDKEKYSETQGVVDLELPKVNVLNGNHYYSFPSDLIELFGGSFTSRTPTPTPEQPTPTPEQPTPTPEQPTPTPEQPTPTPEQPTPTPIPAPVVDVAQRWFYSNDHRKSFNLPTGSTLTNSKSRFVDDGIVSVFEYTITNDSNTYYKIVKYTNANKTWNELGTESVNMFPSALKTELINLFNEKINESQHNATDIKENQLGNSIAISSTGQVSLVRGMTTYNMISSYYGYLHIPVVSKSIFNGSTFTSPSYKVLYNTNSGEEPRVYSNGDNRYVMFHDSTEVSFRINSDGSIIVFRTKRYNPDSTTTNIWHDNQIEVYKDNGSEFIRTSVEIDNIQNPLMTITDDDILIYKDYNNFYFDKITSSGQLTQHLPPCPYSSYGSYSYEHRRCDLINDDKFLVYHTRSAKYIVNELNNGNWQVKYTNDVGYDSTMLYPDELYLNDDYEIIYNFNHTVELKKHNQSVYCKGWLNQPIQPFHFNKLDDTITYYSDNDIYTGYARHTGRTNFTDVVGDQAEAKFLNASSDRTKFTLVTKVPQSSDWNLLDQSHYCDDNENYVSSNWQAAWQASPQTHFDEVIWEFAPNFTAEVSFNARWDALQRLNPWNTTNPELPEYFVVSQQISTIIGKRYEVRYNVYGGSSTASVDTGKGFARTVKFDRTTTIGTDTTTGFGLHYFQFVATTETTYIEFGLDNLDILYDSDIDNYSLGYYAFTQIKVSLVSEQVEISVFDVPSLSDAISLNGSVIDGYIKNAPGQLIDLSNNSIIKEFTSDDLGRWSVDLEQSELPELYKIKFLPGGIDILTNKQVNTTFSNIAKKEDALTSSATLNITPVTTLKSAIVETKIQQKKDSGETYDVDSIISTTKTFVANKFDISESDLELDYIKEQKTDVLKANTKLSVITETLKSTVSAVDSNVTDDAIFASIATEFENTMTSEETSSANISVTDLLSNNIQTIVRNSVDESIEDQITSDSSIVQNIEFISEVVLEVIDTPSDSESTDSFEDSLQAVRKEVLSTIEFVEDVVSTTDISDTTVDTNKDTALESIDDAIELVEDVVIDDMLQPEFISTDPTPTATFASYYFVQEPQSNSYTFNKYHEDESMLAYDTTINGKLFDVLIMKSDGFVELYIGSQGGSGASLGTLQPEYQSNHSNGLNWVNYFNSTYAGLSISSTSNQSQINIVIPDSLLDMAETA